MPFTVAEDQLARIVYAYHHDPFQVLGAHAVQVDGQPAVSVRAFLPAAEEAWVVVSSGEPTPMVRMPGTDFFEALFVGDAQVFAYDIRVLGKNGAVQQFKDPYSFWPVLTDFDLHLFSEGTNQRTYDKLGAHSIVHQGVEGVLFAVWAPNALRVSVIGDFNDWDGRRHPMRVRGSSGLWELFVPGLAEGTIYKYEVKTKSDALLQKGDPQGFAAELRPKTGSIVWNIDKHQWQDQAWMARRARSHLLNEALAIYEVHLGSWMRVPETGGYLSYRDLAHRLCNHVQSLGYTHVELLPVAEFPFDGSWGYQATGYFAPTSRFGTPDDFQYFVDHLHQNGIGVILDWVPAHFPKNDFGLAYFDGTAAYEYEDSRIGEHKAWGTNVFNYGRTEVRQFLIANALFWLDKYHIDGLRVDAVAAMLYRDYGREEWVPNQFGGRENLEAISLLQRVNELVHGLFPGAVTFAEESTAFPAVSRPTDQGGLGFTFKWNMGWMHDTLDYIAHEPVHRKYHHRNLTFGMLYAFSENFVLPISHDEVVHLKRSLIDKMPGDLWQKFANMRLYLGWMWTYPGKKLLFQGQDIGQWREWSEDYSIDWHLLAEEPHRALSRWVADLNRLYTGSPALYSVDYDWTGFQWIDADDWERSTVSYLRRASNPQDFLVVAANFTPVVREDFRLGVPEECAYVEALNSDGAQYFGSGLTNQDVRLAEPVPAHNQPCSVRITLPPLAIVILRPQR